MHRHCCWYQHMWLREKWQQSWQTSDKGFTDQKAGQIMLSTCSKTKKANFFGNTFTSDGHKPENEKVQAINEIAQPMTMKDLQCFLGMVSYLNKYSPWLAELGDSLRELTKKKLLFICGLEHTEAFDVVIKKLQMHPYSNIMTQQVPHHANWCKLERVWCCTLQVDHTVYFASRSYSNIKWHMWWLSLNHLYLLWTWRSSI